MADNPEPGGLTPPAVGVLSPESRRDSLEKRLDDGYRRISEAALGGRDIAEWEAFWIRLLHEYEDVCRELDVAA